MKTLVKVLWGVVTLAIAVGWNFMRMSAPTPYAAAKISFAVATGCFAVLVFLWGITSNREANRLTLWLGIPGVMLPAIILPALFWFMDGRQEQGLIEAAAIEIATATNSDIKSRAAHLISRINDFQLKCDENSNEIFDSIRTKTQQGMTKEERQRNWDQMTARTVSTSTLHNNEWRRYYLPELLAIINASKERIPMGIPDPNIYEKTALDGMLAGVSPASEAAKYLGEVVAKLPD